MLGYAVDMSRLLIATLLCLPLLVSAADFYKWVDRKGVTHYDEIKPKHDAEIITTVDAQPDKPQMSDLPKGIDSDEEEDPGEKYKQFSIAQPEHNETIRSNEGLVKVSFFIAPALRGGHKIILTMDGQKLKDSLTSLQFSLKDLPRGTHTLKADIVDTEGETLISTDVVSFHLRQASILNPM